jgi:protein-tyrosine phosphatase
LAEGILREKLRRLKIPSHLDSCGFESFHVGDQPDPRAVAVARKNGIDITAHRARLFRPRDFDEFDFIFVMDSSHYRNVMKIARDEQDVSRVDYFMNVLNPGLNQPVPDPWYHDLEAFEKVYLQLDEASDAFISSLTKKE